jgi:hypothetical protein
MFTRALHLYLSWARPIQSTPPNNISARSILMLSIHLCLGLRSGLSPSGFPTSNLPLLHHSRYMPCPPYPPQRDNSNYTWWRVQIITSHYAVMGYSWYISNLGFSLHTFIIKYSLSSAVW